MEYMPYLPIQTQYGGIIARPDNTALFLHSVEYAGYDNVKIEIGENEVALIIRAINHDTYEEVEQELLTKGNGEFQVVHSAIPTDYDLKAIGKMIMEADFGDITADWTELDSGLSAPEEAYLHDINCKGCNEDCND